MAKQVVRAAEREVQILSYHSTQKSVRLKEKTKGRNNTGKRKNGNAYCINNDYRGIIGKH